MMEQLTLGIGTRLQHTQHEPGVIVGIRLATYLICFINSGIKEIDKTDPNLEEIIPENVTVELETTSDVEKSLLKILRLWAMPLKLSRSVSGGKMVPCYYSLQIKPKRQKKFL